MDPEIEYDFQHRLSTEPASQPLKYIQSGYFYFPNSGSSHTRATVKPQSHFNAHK
jgi:hypothetical protein